MIDTTLAFITAHAAWAGPIAGVLCFGESLAIFGLLIPATTVMLAIGGLIGAGILPPEPIFLCAFIGAFLGDWVSYEWGRWLGPAMYRKRPFTRYRKAIARTRLIFRKYGVLGVFLGRFSGPIRATIPLVAGSLGLSRRKFQIANFASALIWVPLMLSPGYLAAHHWQALWANDNIRIALIGGALVLSLGALGYWAYRKRKPPRPFP